MIAATVLAVASCSWSNPGHDRFTGTEAAVEDYQDIPPPVRAVLRERIRKHDYDDVATISGDNIKGASEYDDLREMHFGKNKVCRTVERKWKPDHKEVGMVYCASDHCLIVPTVCGNIAVVTRRKPVAGRQPEGGGAVTSAGGSAPAVVAGAPLPSLDDMPPTGAGVRSDAGTFAGGSVGTATSGAGGAGVAYASSVPVLGSGQGFAVGGGGFIGGITTGSAIPAVPEPSTWASLALGLSALGWKMRRRQKA